MSAPGMRRSRRAADDHDGQHAEADGQRPPVDLVEVGEHVGDPVLVRAGGRRQAQEVGQLVDDDDDGHAGQEADDDGRREELGDPAQAQDAHQHHDEHRPSQPGSPQGRRSGPSPVRARADTPAAKSGAIVESAPTEICGFEPKSAKSTVPATKA